MKTHGNKVVEFIDQPRATGRSTYRQAPPSAKRKKLNLIELLDLDPNRWYGPEEVAARFAQKLEEARLLGYTQVEIARMAGVHPSTLYYLKKGLKMFGWKSGGPFGVAVARFATRAEAA